jgi:hypothetical protein
MGAHNPNLASWPGMAIAILATILAAGLPAEAHHFDHHPHFKGKSEPEGVVLWFNSVLRASGVPRDQLLSLCVTNQVISWREGNRTESIQVPDAIVAFKPWETFAHTFYGLAHWDTSAPNAQAASDTFMSGVAVPLPDGPPTNARNLTWTAQFSTNTPGVTVRWEWSVASYTQFSDNYNALGLAVSDIVAGKGKNRTVDDAGTPVAFKAFIAGDDDDDDCDDDDDGSAFIGERSATIVAPAAVTGICAGGGIS